VNCRLNCKPLHTSDEYLVVLVPCGAVISDFMSAIDNAVTNLEEDGIVGVADFFTSAKYDIPNRQHSYIQRWFWRSIFDVDGIGRGLCLADFSQLMCLS
jgi:hypothetical protein